MKNNISDLLNGLECIHPCNENDLSCPHMEDLGKVGPEDIYNMITEKILSVIENDKELAWQKPSTARANTGLAATNYISKKPYRALMLLCLI